MTLMEAYEQAIDISASSPLAPLGGEVNISLVVGITKVDAGGKHMGLVFCMGGFTFLVSNEIGAAIAQKLYAKYEDAIEVEDETTS